MAGATLEAVEERAQSGTDIFSGKPITVNVAWIQITYHSPTSSYLDGSKFLKSTIMQVIVSGSLVEGVSRYREGDAYWPESEDIAILRAEMLVKNNDFYGALTSFPKLTETSSLPLKKKFAELSYLCWKKKAFRFNGEDRKFFQNALSYDPALTVTILSEQAVHSDDLASKGEFDTARDTLRFLAKYFFYNPTVWSRLCRLSIVEAITNRQRGLPYGVSSSLRKADMYCGTSQVAHKFIAEVGALSGERHDAPPASDAVTVESVLAAPIVDFESKGSQWYRKNGRGDDVIELRSDGVYVQTGDMLKHPVPRYVATGTFQIEGNRIVWRYRKKDLWGKDKGMVEEAGEYGTSYFLDGEGVRWTLLAGAYGVE